LLVWNLAWEIGSNEAIPSIHEPGEDCLLAVIGLSLCSAAIYWEEQTRVALIAMQTDIDIPAWLEDNGFTVSWQKHALQLAAMLTPFIAGSFSITGRELLL
jgi:hypothetical protein